MKFNKYIPFALLYFFFNSVGLPFGLTYMALLGPFFYVWVVLKRKKEILLPFLALMLPFVIVHLSIVRVDLPTYGMSFLNIVLVYIFCQAFYTFLKVCKEPESIFKVLLVLNFFFCIVGIVFYFTPWDHLFWIQQELTQGVRDFRRFRLFTYEASYYATLFIPIFFFYFLQYIFRQNKIRSGLLLIMIFLPYFISFSLGVIAAAGLSFLITLFIHFRSLIRKKRLFNLAIYAGAGLGSVFAFLVVFFRHNPLFTRIINIFSGSDSSGKGRTIDAFILAKKLLNGKNDLWGIGIGQIKLLGEELIRGYYLYNMEYTATIPNAMAEALVIFGWIGFMVKLVIEIGLFIYTKVWTNYYRMLLFFFIFIYQFTGSFITNLAEYVIWILAFTNVFTQFDVKARRIDGEAIERGSKQG